MAKGPLKSKTIWLGLVTSVVSVAASKWPELGAWVQDHYSVIGGALGIVIIVLRGLTGKPLTLSGN
jgi:hypothetical protein